MARPTANVGGGLMSCIHLATAKYIHRFRHLRFKHMGMKYGILRTPMLEPYISKSVSRRGSKHTNLQPRKLFKLQLDLIGISDIEWIKRNVPLLDSEKISKVE